MQRNHSVELLLNERATYDEICDLVETTLTDDVQCVQQVADKKWIVTTKTAEGTETLMTTELKIGENTVHTAPAGKNLHYVTVMYAPFEMKDTSVAAVMSSYGEVHAIRRGHWQQHRNWENGNRHLRMEIDRKIPSYITVNGFQLVVKYTGQKETCRKCSEEGHKAATCPNIRCNSCQQYGHMRKNCPQPSDCTNCKSTEHTTQLCPHTYANRVKKSPLLSEQSSGEDEEEKQTQPEPPQPPRLKRKKRRNERENKPDAPSSTKEPLQPQPGPSKQRETREPVNSDSISGDETDNPEERKRLKKYFKRHIPAESYREVCTWSNMEMKRRISRLGVWDNYQLFYEMGCKTP